MPAKGQRVEYGRLSPVQEVKASGDSWEVSGHVSTFGNVDAQGDVVMHGAFDDTLKSGRKVKFLMGHDSRLVLGTPLELKADDTGLFGRFKISKTQLGQDVHTLLKDGALDSFSIGYIPDDIEFDESGVRLLKGIDLLECSVVAIPANDQALVTGVKHHAEDGLKAEDWTPELEAIDAELKAEWTTAYVNNLPDSAFAVILPGGSKDSEGKTTPRSLRKLPHHDAQGNIDMAHLRNAMSRLPQTDMSAAAMGKARSHLEGHARGAGMGKMALPDLLRAFQVEIASQKAANAAPDAATVELLEALRAGADELLNLKAAELVEAKADDEAEAAGMMTGGLRLRLDLTRRRLARRGVLDCAQ